MNNKRSAMTLYSDSKAHASHRVRIVLAEKGIAVDVMATSPEKLPAFLHDLNPYNTLPILLDRDDLVLFEPRVIMEYLDERFPHPPLLPVYPVARAKSRLWIYRLDKEWTPWVDTLLGKSSPAALEKARNEFKSSLVAVAPVFAEKPFFLSDEFSLMDCCLAPILWRLPLMGIELENNVHNRPLLEYMQRVFARDTFQASLSDEERLMRS
jgi:RNA polymerase-associated protein